MGIRETLNEKKQLGVGVGIAIIVIGLGLVIWEAAGPNHPSSSGVSKLYYTIDNGQSWFADDKENVPPYLHNGKEAVLAHVYAWSNGTFVAYMEKYTPAAQAKLAAVPAGAARDSAAIDYQTQILVKTPIGQFWVKRLSAQGDKIVNNRHPPNGNPEQGFEIFP